MQNLISIAIAPIILLLIYIYIKDKYEKEPKLLVLKCFILGVVSSIPIMYFERFFTQFTPNENFFYYALYISFIVASFTEETFKFFIFYCLILKNKKNNYYFNEPFDGLVYCAFISLGFAFIENILYVLSPSMGGINTGILRSIFSVPAHFIFAIYMGNYLSKYKFNKLNNKILLLLAYIVPIFIHGIYDLLLFSDMYYIQILFLIYYIYIVLRSKFIISRFISISPFKNFD